MVKSYAWFLVSLEFIVASSIVPIISAVSYTYVCKLMKWRILCKLLYFMYM